MNKRQSYSRASEFQHRTFNGASVAFSRQDWHHVAVEDNSFIPGNHKFGKMYVLWST
jgi:pentose-5-phosphate-3-epimerase